MILYHGTYEQRALDILSGGLIKSNGIARNYDEDDLNPTTDGYVYLTDKLPLSIYYGARVIPIGSPDHLYIFEVEIDQTELEVDEDEIEVMSIWGSIKKKIELAYPLSVEDSLDILHSVRVKRNLIVGIDIKRYLILPTTNYIDLIDPKNKELDEIHQKSKILMIKQEKSTIEDIDSLFNLVEWVNI